VVILSIGSDRKLSGLLSFDRFRAECGMLRIFALWCTGLRMGTAPGPHGRGQLDAVL
jgi:hypothetical protein